MKKTFAMLLAAVVVTTALSGCNLGGDNSSSESSSSSQSSSESTSSTPGDTLRENTKLEDIIKAVHEEFGEYGAVTMPDVLTQEMLKDQYGLSDEDVEEFYGEYSMVNTNSDHLIAIKAKPGKVDKVKQALEKRKADLEAQFEQYPVNGSYDRAKSAEVYVRGDYAFLIAVGHLPENPDDAPEFDKQVRKARDVIDGFFA